MIQRINRTLQYFNTHKNEVFLNSVIRISKPNEQKCNILKSLCYNQKVFYSNNYVNENTIMKEENPESKQKLNLESLTKYKRKISFEIVSAPKVKKLRTTVDLQSMKEELKQLEDPPATLWEKEISSKRLPYSFYDVPCETLAKNMLGKILVRKLTNGTILKGKIVETESYLGIEDKASHTYGGKVTRRNLSMYMPPGTIYVYIVYGMYHCFNISSKEKGSAVLIRSLEPLEGIDHMIEYRSRKQNTKSPEKLSKNLKVHELCNGPSKMCISMQLQEKCNKYSICDWKELWIEDNEIKEEMKIIECPRIGIESAGEEWAKKPLRFYIYGDKCVSKRNKTFESALLQ